MGYLVTRGLGSKASSGGTSGGGGPATIDDPSADDLLGVIKGQFTSVAQLVSDVGGRIYLGKAGANTSFPYVVIQDDSRLEKVTSDSELFKSHLRFRVYATDMDQAGPIGDNIEAAFRGKSLSWSGGFSSQLVPERRSQRLESGKGYTVSYKGKGGAEVFYLELTFQCRVKRTLS